MLLLPERKTGEEWDSSKSSVLWKSGNTGGKSILASFNFQRVHLITSLQIRTTDRKAG